MGLESWMQREDIPRDLREAIRKDLKEKDKLLLQLQNREAHYRYLLESIPFGIKEFDIKGTILYANNPMHQILGFSPGEMLGKSVFDFCMNYEEALKLEKYMQQLVEEQPQGQHSSHWRKTRAGDFIQVGMDWHFNKNASGDVVGFTTIVQKQMMVTH